MPGSILVSIVNNSPHSASISVNEQREGYPASHCDVMIGPRSKSDAFMPHLTMPCVSNAAEFDLSHLEVSVGDLNYQLWQDETAAQPGMHVTTDGAWHKPAGDTRLPGLETAASGKRCYRLTIDEECRLTGTWLADDTVPADMFSLPDAQAQAEAENDLELLSLDSVPAGQYIDHIHARLKTLAPEFEGATYAKSDKNTLDPATWLLQSPNYWGKSAADLPENHSHFLGTHIREMISKAEHLVDITTLYPFQHSGWFAECLASAISNLIRKDRPITIRIIMGTYPSPQEPWAGYIDNTSIPLLERLAGWVKELAGSKLKIYVASVTASPLSWNHSKIIAVDERYAMVGGHNWWAQDYLCWAPVHDVSMQLDGPAARCAQTFCNAFWGQIQTEISRFIPTPGFFSHRYDGPSGRIVKRSACVTTVSSGQFPTGNSKVLAVGRLGNFHRYRANQSDEAFYTAIALAKKSIKMSQQDLLFWTLPDKNLFGELAAAILRKVDVEIVVTTYKATSGAGGLAYSTGATPEATTAVLTGITMLVARNQRIPPEEATRRLHDHFKVTSIRFSGDERWPKERKYSHYGQAYAAHGIANHAKVWIVDDQIFYIGSQNAYPSVSHQEFGCIVEGHEETAQLLKEYWNPLWHASSRGVYALPEAEFGSPPDPVETAAE